MSTQKQDNKLGLIALTAMCVGSMIGAGLFALPQNVSYVTGVGAMLIAWTIAFLGMICLAKVFQNLSMRRPELDAGIYAYAREGFGDYLGFNSAWGYWISAWLGNVSYVMMTSSALTMFFPILDNGAGLASFALSSVIMWTIAYLCLLGVKSAAEVNVITTIAKIIPIAVFIIIIACAFSFTTFKTDIWQTARLGSLTGQVKGMMLITVWLFIGIEGASVFSARARKRKDIGRATIISFLVIFSILIAISLLPFGVLSGAKLADLPNPSTSAVLAHVVGRWGAVFMNVGLVVAVLGAFLAWVLIAAEVPYVAGKKDGLFPKIFIKENKKGSPAGSILITTASQQLYLVLAYFYKAGYLVTLLLATAMILLPYLLSALDALLLAVSGKTYERNKSNQRTKDLIISGVAVIYGIWLLYSASKYLLFSSVLYFIGAFVYIINKRKRRLKVFTKHEKILFLLITVLAVACVIALATKSIAL